MIALVAAMLAVAPVTNAANGKMEEPKAVTANTLTVKVEEVGKLVFKVQYENLTKKKANIVIRDAENNVLFEQYASTDVNYKRKFDFSSLIDGTYTFEVSAGDQKFSQSFQILTQTSRTVLAKN